MRSWVLFALPVLPMPLLAAALLLPSAPPASKAAAPAFEKSVAAFFARSCTACHNTTAKAGGVDLGPFGQPDSVRRNRETWEAILRKLRTGEMPPHGSPKPAPAQLKAMTARIESEIERVDRLSAANPGRVTARRLNRTEYNNTVADLLAVNIRPADDFPQDDSGYGFD